MLEAGKRREARFQGQPLSLGDTLNLAIAILGELVPLQPVTLTLHLSQCGVICAKRRERSERANSSEMALVLTLGTFLVYDLFSFSADSLLGLCGPHALALHPRATCTIP